VEQVIYDSLALSTVSDERRTLINLAADVGLAFLAEVVKMEARISQCHDDFSSSSSSSSAGRGRLLQLRLLFVTLLVMCTCDEGALVLGYPLQTITLNVNNHFTKAFTFTTSQAILGTVQPRSQITFSNVIFAGLLFVADEDNRKTRSVFPLTWTNTDAANPQVRYQQHQLRAGRSATTPRRNLLVVVGVHFRLQKSEDSALVNIEQLVKGAPSLSPLPFPGPPEAPSPSPSGGPRSPISVPRILMTEM